MQAKEKCASCGAFGVGVVGANGLCAHCTRMRTDTNGGTNSNTTSSHAGAGATGTKRKHTDISGGAPSLDYDVSASLDRELTPEEVARLVSQASDIPSLDANGVKKMLLGLEKKISRNQMARAKYAGEPARFMESEVELDEELKKMRSLAAAPEHYDILLKSDCLKSILDLLAHDNSDIAIEAVKLLVELTDAEGIDVDEAADSDEEKGGQAALASLVEAIVDQGGLDLILSNLVRLESSGAAEDREGLYITLNLIENFLLLKPTLSDVFFDTTDTSLSSTTTSTTSLPAFLFRQLAEKKFDDSKLYASELLSIITQHNPAKAAQVLGEGTFPLLSRGSHRLVDGVEFVCQLVNGYKKGAPTLPEEQECVQNIFGVLCTLLTTTGNQDRLRAIEGVQLLISVVEHAGFARLGALKALGFAIANHAANAETFVEAGGLKEVFPAFMGKSEQHTKKLHGAEAIAEEQHAAVTILAHCLQSLPQPHPAASVQSLATHKVHGNGLFRVRLLAKFKENHHEKIDRLLDLFRNFCAAAEAAGLDTSEEFDEEGLDEAAIAKLREYQETVQYSARLRSGLATVQRIALCVATLCTESSTYVGRADEIGIVVEPSLLTFVEDVSFAARSKLYEQGVSLVTIADILVEQLHHIDDSSAISGWASDEDTKAYMQALLDRLAAAAGVSEVTESSVPSPSQDIAMS